MISTTNVIEEICSYDKQQLDRKIIKWIMEELPMKINEATLKTVLKMAAIHFGLKKDGDWSWRDENNTVYYNTPVHIPGYTVTVGACQLFLFPDAHILTRIMTKTGDYEIIGHGIYAFQNEFMGQVQVNGDDLVMIDDTILYIKFGATIRIMEKGLEFVIN